MSESRIGQLLDSLPELQSLKRELKKLATLQNAVREVLPFELAKCTSVASVKSGSVILYASNSPAAAKLKQITPRILFHLRKQHHDITGIVVQVQVTIPVNALPQKHIVMGPQARSALDALAERLDASPLKSAVRRLRER